MYIYTCISINMYIHIYTIYIYIYRYISIKDEQWTTYFTLLTSFYEAHRKNQNVQWPTGFQGLERTEPRISSALLRLSKTGLLHEPHSLSNIFLMAGLVRPSSMFFPVLPYFSRATRAELTWQAESSYIVPTAEKDALPHASEGMRRTDFLGQTIQTS